MSVKLQFQCYKTVVKKREKNKYELLKFHFSLTSVKHLTFPWPFPDLWQPCGKLPDPYLSGIFMIYKNHKNHDLTQSYRHISKTAVCYNTIPRSKPTSFFGVLLPPTFKEWYMTTTWRGESPTSSWALTSAPLSKRSLAMVTCLLSTARRRGVCWRPFRRLTSEPGRACNEVAKT